MTVRKVTTSCNAHVFNAAACHRSAQMWTVGGMGGLFMI